MTAIELTTLVAFAAGSLCLIMTAAWWVQRKTQNSGWVDTTWSFGVGIVGVACAVLPLSSGGFMARRWLVALLAAIWCGRLGLHIAARTRSSADDPRYRALIEEWEQAAPSRLFWFLQAQAAVGTILVMAIVLAAHNPKPGLHISDAIGVVILLGAVTGEAVSDAQLAEFRTGSANSGRVCDVGLWAWSRHPNYFFEWVAWFSYCAIGVDMFGHYNVGWLTLAAPLSMYWVLVHASGIPPTEAHMLRTRGEQYRAYRARTSAFFPWPPK